MVSVTFLTVKVLHFRYLTTSPNIVNNNHFQNHVFYTFAKDVLGSHKFKRLIQRCSSIQEIATVNPSKEFLKSVVLGLDDVSITNIVSFDRNFYETTGQVPHNKNIEHCFLEGIFMTSYGLIPLKIYQFVQRHGRKSVSVSSNCLKYFFRGLKIRNVTGWFIHGSQLFKMSNRLKLSDAVIVKFMPFLQSFKVEELGKDYLLDESWGNSIAEELREVHKMETRYECRMDRIDRTRSYSYLYSYKIMRA